MKVIRMTLKFFGVEVTSGADFFLGKSANVEACSFIEALSEFCLSNNYSFELISIKGGEIVSNVPGYCCLTFSLSNQLEDFSAFFSFFEWRKSNPYISGISYEIEETV